MPVYLVRLSKSRDIVGFFAAENLDELTIAVDEYIDVPAREYVELPVGGIMWSSPAGPVPFNVRDLEDEETEFPELPWASAELSESWWDVIYGYTDETWIAFDLEAPQVPMPEPPQRQMGPARVVPLRPRKGADRG